MEKLEETIKNRIVSQLTKFSLVEIKESDLIPQINKHFNPKLGDYQFNVQYLHRFKAVKKGAESDLALQWFKRFVCDDIIQDITVADTFLGFKVNRFLLCQAVIQEIVLQKEKYGWTTLGENKRVLVEYSSPNIAKPFHIGHLRSTIIGNFVKNLYTAMGYQVVSINYLGDWGKQYGLLAIGFEKYGDEAKLLQDPMTHLYELYVKINQDLKRDETLMKLEAEKTQVTEVGEAVSEVVSEAVSEALGEAVSEAVEKTDGKDVAKVVGKEIEEANRDEKVDLRCQLELDAQEYFQRMENQDPEALKLWRRLRTISIGIYEKTYERLGIKFDVYSGESQAIENQVQLQNVCDALSRKKLLQKDKKGTFVDLTKYKLGYATILKSNNTTLYLTRDLAEVEKRYAEKPFEECIYVVGDSQKYYFDQFFKLLELTESKTAGKCKHVGFGQVIGMSTRKGQAIFLADILNEAKDKMLEVMSENKEKLNNVENPELTADRLGISAVIVQDLSAKRSQNYNFDWERITSFQGNTGPYLQYAHARICSIIRKVSTKLNFSAKLELLVEDEAFLLIKLIGQYPAILKGMLDKLEPVTLVDYLMDLSKGIAVAHIALKVKDQENDLSEARLLLFWSAKTTLAAGLRMLGLVPIEAM